MTSDDAQPGGGGFGNYHCATVKVGSHERDEWTNVGVLIYDFTKPDRPLVGQRFVTDWQRVQQRMEGRWPAVLIQRNVEIEIEGYRTFDAVERGGSPYSPVWVRHQGGSIEPDLETVIDTYYGWCCYDPTHPRHRKEQSDE